MSSPRKGSFPYSVGQLCRPPVEGKLPHGFTWLVQSYKQAWGKYPGFQMRRHQGAKETKIYTQSDPVHQLILVPGAVSKKQQQQKWLLWILSIEAAALEMVQRKSATPWITNTWMHDQSLASPTASKKRWLNVFHCFELLCRLLVLLAVASFHFLSTELRLPHP